jgi:hypothetical protein
VVSIQQVEIKIESLDEEDEDEIQFDMEITDAADMGTKLDALMDILFTFIFRESQRSEKHREQMFFMLMQLFDTFILKTHKSKYVQFLLFYVCAMDINYTHVRCAHAPPPRSSDSDHRRTHLSLSLFFSFALSRAGLCAIPAGEGDGREQPPAHAKHMRGLPGLLPRPIHARSHTARPRATTEYAPPQACLS